VLFFGIGGSGLNIISDDGGFIGWEFRLFLQEMTRCDAQPPLFSMKNSCIMGAFPTK
jgi:hypothetical protein